MKITIWTDSEGFVVEWTTASSDDPDAKQVEFDPEQLLGEDCRLYQFKDGKLKYTTGRKGDLARLDLQDEIRSRREVECYPIINRGGLWYDLLNDKQRDELLDWYTAWLDAPDTLNVPKMPSWIK